jgi:hypothetical protein
VTLDSAIPEHLMGTPGRKYSTKNSDVDFHYVSAIAPSDVSHNTVIEAPACISSPATRRIHVRFAEMGRKPFRADKVNDAGAR